MEQNLKIGDFVVITTHTSEIFMGEVISISPRNFELYKIVRQDTFTRIDCPMIFYFDEINEVVTFQNKQQYTPIRKQLSNGINGVSKSVKYIYKTSSVSFMEYKKLADMSLNFKFVSLYSKLYENAIETLSNSEIVGVCALGNTFTHGKPLSLLVFSTLNEVYIFDMKTFNNTTKLDPIIHILQSPCVKKIVHGGHALYSSLYHYYKLKMNNVSDTQISDYIFRLGSESLDENKFRGLPECLDSYLNFPAHLLGETIKDKTWHERPLSKLQLVRAAQLATCLPVLYRYFVQNICRADHDASLSKILDDVKSNFVADN